MVLTRIILQMFILNFYMTTITIHTKIGSITNTMNKTPIHINVILTYSNIVIKTDLSKSSRDFSKISYTAALIGT